MLINVSEGEECRIALLNDGKLEELYMERTSATSHVGNIYKGKVTNVEPSIQAAFIDFGLPRNGFLHITDLLPQYFGHKGEEKHESVGRKMARRDRPPIQKCLRRGDEITVQIIKEGIGTKGPTLSTYLSIPGRILVMMPGMSQLGVSRKIEDETERRRLRQILDSLKPPKECGFIIRTAGIGKTKADIERDLKYLTRLWEDFKKTRDSGPAPIELYREGDLVTRTVRDVLSTDIKQIVVDSKEVAKRVKAFVKLAMPRTKNKVELHEELTPLFNKYGIEHEIERIYDRHVPLPSGGSLVIDSTEAVVAIDVNSGKFRDHADAETTAFKTDMEAADEITRQLKLRDLGGVIICDFIDLRFERHRRELEQRLLDNFKNDRARTQVLRMSQFGIVEITRQRMRPSLKRSIYSDCPHCKGTGLVKTSESMSLDMMRRLAMAAQDERVHRIELNVCPPVCQYLQNGKRRQLVKLEEACGKKIVILPDAMLGPDELRLALFDQRDGQVVIHDLLPASQQQSQSGRADSRRDHPGQSRHRQGERGRGRAQAEPAADARDELRALTESQEPNQEPGEEAVEPQAETVDKTPAPKQPTRDGQADRGRDAQPKTNARPAESRDGGRRHQGRGGRGRDGQSRNQSRPSGNGNPQAQDRRQPYAPKRELSLAERLAGIMDYPDDPDENPSGRRQPATPLISEDEQPGNAAPAASTGDATANPRRRRRGGRGRGRGRDVNRNDTSAATSQSAGRQPASVGLSDEPPPRIVDAAPVATGTRKANPAAVEDEPTAPRRPRSFGDLDEIPDDFD